MLALNGMGATSDQCQCESDKDLTVFEIENHEYLPATAQAIAAPYKFPLVALVTSVLAQSPTSLHESLLPSQYP